MNITTVIIRYATTTGRSSWKIESMTSLPMPGHAKIDSVTIANAITEPSSSPITVTSGIMMFFSRCTPSTRRRVRPFARANLM